MAENTFTTSSGEEIPVIVETRRGLRNMTLRPKIVPRREIHISKPWLVTTGSALRFLNQKSAWLDKFFANSPQKRRLSSGDTLEFLGKTVVLQHDATGKSNYWFPSAGGVPAGRGGLPNIAKTLDCHVNHLADKNWTLVIGGGADMFERRVRDFVKNELLTEIKKITKTAPPEFHPTRITLRDTTSRWGSCSGTGAVSFSWRLAFAPYEVMRYVVLHELAHRKHMDHSADFWATVSRLYGDQVGRAKRWLTQNGAKLHGYF